MPSRRSRSPAHGRCAAGRWCRGTRAATRRARAASPANPDIKGTTMALYKPYQDVPGTTIFDAEQSRKGYWLNQFCMSLMKPENRVRFKANEQIGRASCRERV